MKKTDNRRAPSVQRDIDASADQSNKDLDKVWRKLFPVGRVPKNLLERNQMIYSAMGYVPKREG